MSNYGPSTDLPFSLKVNQRKEKFLKQEFKPKKAHKTALTGVYKKKKHQTKNRGMDIISGACQITENFKLFIDI